MASATIRGPIEVNAFDGKGTFAGHLSDTILEWALANEPARVRTWLKAPPDADPRNWADPRNGWGLVLPAPAGPTLPTLPAPLAELLARRSEAMGTPAPVLHYDPGPEHLGCLLRDGEPLPVSQSLYGTQAGAVPRYLLICAGPEQIPWQVQYALNVSGRCVGRLPLAGSGLENYVRALLDDWRGSAADPHAALVWAAQNGPLDITTLLRRSIAEPVVARLRNDDELRDGLCYLDGSVHDGATAASLACELAARKPGFVLTTSHGMAGPLDDVAQMQSQLGFLVGSGGQLVGPELLRDWQPDGAIWYAHACCSAGSDSTSTFDALFEAASPMHQLLRGVARCGARVAPLPLALLGAAKPLRAFIGHVEPTFNWTLMHKQTARFTTAPLTQALYGKLFQPLPLGHALEALFAPVAGLYAAYDRARDRASAADMLYRLLVVRDLQGTVILGDPTVALPL
ncbi:hypothetical protein [Massilia sp. DWR3-1-1]|uniref:hypothetical protein n=1 Tax=Massilia sp. DWR3-1-1 TaxID=2804559 RepID=UPI003CE85466